MAKTATKTSEPKPVLKEDQLYLNEDRVVCGRIHCAGMTARFTGRSLHGVKVIKVTPAIREEWRRSCEEYGDVDPTMRCESCGQK